MLEHYIATGLLVLSTLSILLLAVYTYPLEYQEESLLIFPVSSESIYQTSYFTSELLQGAVIIFAVWHIISMLIVTVFYLNNKFCCLNATISTMISSTFICILPVIFTFSLLGVKYPRHGLYPVLNLPNRDTLCADPWALRFLSGSILPPSDCYQLNINQTDLGTVCCTREKLSFKQNNQYFANCFIGIIIVIFYISVINYLIKRRKDAHNREIISKYINMNY